jgi:hypothetical protein
MLAPLRVFTRQSVGERKPSLPTPLKPRRESTSLFPDEAFAANTFPARRQPFPYR